MTVMNDKVVFHFSIYRTDGVKSPSILDPRISNAYFKVAQGLNIPVNELQAITWHSFRNKYQNRRALAIRKGRNITK